MVHLDKLEIKLFLTFLIIYLFFIRWTSWNEYSRFALTRAIVDEAKFEIDNFYNQTGDRSYYNNHYYSDKNPGISFLAVPIYTFWKTLSDQSNLSSNQELVHLYSDVPIIYENKPNGSVLSSMALVTIFTSCIFSALTALLVYKISKYFTENQNHSILITLIYALATLAFPNALVFIEHTLATFFLFLSFFLLIKAKKEKIKDKKTFFLMGIFSGVSVVISFEGFLFPIFLLVYLFSFEKNKSFIYIFGFILGILCFLLYNYVIFGNIFEISQTYLNFPSQFGTSYELTKINYLEKVMNRLNNKTTLSLYLSFLFSPYRGLFFYYPILLLAFLGLYYMRKENREEAIFILILFIFQSVYLFSIIPYNLGGISFGIRHYLSLVPFLTLPIICTFKRINIKIVYMFFILCIVINFLGLQYLESPVMYLQTLDKWRGDYLKNIQLKNILLDYFLPLTIKNGPRSILFENFILDSIIDIRLTLHSCNLTPTLLKKTEVTLFHLPNIGFIALKIPLLWVIPLTLLLFLIWRKEICKKLEEQLLTKKLIFMLVLVTFLISFIEIADFIYDKNWYAPEPNIKDGKIIELDKTERWMSQNATILLFNHNNSIEKTNLRFDVRSFYKNRTLEIYLNEKIISKHSINNSVTINQPLELLPGRNEIKFYSLDGCDIPTNINSTWCDFRCLSFAFKDIIVSKSSEYPYILENKNISDYLIK
jgi:hypothetical protein